MLFSLHSSAFILSQGSLGFINQLEEAVPGRGSTLSISPLGIHFNQKQILHSTDTQNCSSKVPVTTLEMYGTIFKNYYYEWGEEGFWSLIAGKMECL